MKPHFPWVVNCPAVAGGSCSASRCGVACSSRSRLHAIAEFQSSFRLRAFRLPLFVTTEAGPARDATGSPDCRWLLKWSFRKSVVGQGRRRKLSRGSSVCKSPTSTRHRPFWKSPGPKCPATSRADLSCLCLEAKRSLSGQPWMTTTMSFRVCTWSVVTTEFAQHPTSSSASI